MKRPERKFPHYEVRYGNYNWGNPSQKQVNYYIDFGYLKEIIKEELSEYYFSHAQNFTLDEEYDLQIEEREESIFALLDGLEYYFENHVFWSSEIKPFKALQKILLQYRKQIERDFWKWRIEYLKWEFERKTETFKRDLHNAEIELCSTAGETTCDVCSLVAVCYGESWRDEIE